MLYLRNNCFANLPWDQFIQVDLKTVHRYLTELIYKRALEFFDSYNVLKHNLVLKINSDMLVSVF